jgi:hypothetical protein
VLFYHHHQNHHHHHHHYDHYFVVLGFELRASLGSPFGDRISLFAQAGLDHDNPLILSFLLLPGCQVHTIIPNFFPLIRGLAIFFAGAGLKQ